MKKMIGGSCREEGLEPAVGFDSPVVSAGLWRTFHVRGEHEVYRGAKQGAERYNTCVLGYTACAITLSIDEII